MPSTPDEGAQRESAHSLTAIGNFDGVHRGHQAMLSDARAIALERGLRLVILTFHPHPAKVLRNMDVPVLTSLDRKRELLPRAAEGAEVVVEPFTVELASQSPETFAGETLAERLRARVVVVGTNFCFGKNRSGNFATLSKLGERFGYETRSHPMVGDERGPWSSSRIREAVQRGDVEEAARMLGRPHMLSGVVVEGQKRGRTIGFPTCNVSSVLQALPSFGVYGVLVDRVDHPENQGARELPTSRALARGVANIGLRPTVSGGDPAPSVEVHLFDTEGDFYGAALRVHLMFRLRAEQKFPSFAELRAQIERDAEQARGRLMQIAEPPEGSAWA